MSGRPSRREILAGAAAAGLAAALPRVALGRDAADAKPPLVVSTWRHGVAANEAAFATLSGEGTVLDAVVAGVRVSEADPQVSSVGYGGRPNADGVVQLDAAVMVGATREAGCVAAIEKIKHPVSVARLVMEKTPHVLLVGDGARRFAVEHLLFSEPYAFSPETARALERRGHELRIVPEICEVLPVKGEAGGEMQAAQDPRGPGAAGVVRPAID